MSPSNYQLQGYSTRPGAKLAWRRRYGNSIPAPVCTEFIDERKCSPYSHAPRLQHIRNHLSRPPMLTRHPFFSASDFRGSTKIERIVETAPLPVDSKPSKCLHRPISFSKPKDLPQVEIILKSPFLHCKLQRQREGEQVAVSGWLPAQLSDQMRVTLQCLMRKKRC